MANPLRRYDYQLRENITTLKQRMGRLNRLSFTHDEFLALFAPVEDHDILKRAAEVANVTASGGSALCMFKHHGVTGEAVQMMFVVSADGAPLMPRNTTVLRNAPKELVDRLVTWANREIEVAMQFSRAENLIYWLNNHCDTKDQVRFIWPTILALCSVREGTVQLADKIREFKPARKLPTLPMEVRAACRETAGTIATALLLDPNEEPWSVPVYVKLTSADHRVNEGALGWITA